MAHQGRGDCAGWGGNLSRAARKREVAGTIVHGAVRDVDEAIEISYPVFATEATPLTARGRAEEKAWGATVERRHRSRAARLLWRRARLLTAHPTRSC
ncbi:MAG: hypothetical protein OEW83_20520 [Acidimicrobiia bacterium]|nr:hypothetical protein [Acidimicrobiia bacterium]